MIRILNAEPLGFSAEANRVLTSFSNVVARSLDRAGLLDELPGFDALIVRLRFLIDEEVLAAGKQLRAVATPATGLDHIDLQAAEARGIAVISLRGERSFLDSIHATAEHTWALLLALIRHIPRAADSVLDGGWDRDSLRGRELFGRQLGIVGFGRVGQQVARFGRAFGMPVGAYDPGVSKWPRDVRRYPTLSTLLGASDVVTLHVPLGESTEGMIGKTELVAMRPAAVLINTARGELIDEDALVSALEGRAIAGAALDVIANERSPSRGASLLAYASDHDNLLITPHVAGATHESMERTEIRIATRLAEFFRGGP